MIRHVVFFEFTDGTSDDQVAAMHAALAALPDQIAAIHDYTVGSDIGITDGAKDFAVVADFASVEDYETYRVHPAHRSVVDTYVNPIVDHISRIQFEY